MCATVSTTKPHDTYGADPPLWGVIHYPKKKSGDREAAGAKGYLKERVGFAQRAAAINMGLATWTGVKMPIVAVAAALLAASWVDEGLPMRFALSLTVVPVDVVTEL